MRTKLPKSIDNCQHVLLRCCVNLLDFYQRLGVRDRIRFYREFYFIEPGGRISMLHARRAARAAAFHRIVPAPAFPGRGGQTRPSRAACWRCAASALRRDDLDRITMLDWLREKRQTPRAIERFWRQVLVSAINEDLDRMAARHGFQVFWLGLLARADAYEMGVPAVPLGELYASGTLASGRRCMAAAARARGAHRCGRHRAPAAHATRPIITFARCLSSVCRRWACRRLRFEHSPITGIHLWFDRAVTDLPHATLLDRTMQWMFNKSEGRYLQLVVSASRALETTSRAEIIALALKRAGRIFPARAGGAAGKGARDQRSARDVFRRAGHGSAAAARRNGASGSLSGGRLDALRLARHHGRRGAQRIPGGGGRRARERPAGAIPAPGYRMISCGADDRFVSSAQPRERQTTKNDGLSHGGIGH